MLSWRKVKEKAVINLIPIEAPSGGNFLKLLSFLFLYFPN